MAAVAAEPGAAAASTTTVGDGLEYEAEPGEHAAGLEPDSVAGFAPKMELCHQAESVDAVQECSQVRMEIRRPDLQLAGNALRVHEEDGDSDPDESALTERTQYDTRGAEERLKEPLCANEPAAENEVSSHESIACFPPCSGSHPERATVLSHSVADHDRETGFSVTETDAPAHSDPESSTHPVDQEPDFEGLKTIPEPEAASDALCSDRAEDAFHEHPQSPKSQSTSSEETSFRESLAHICTSDSSNMSSKDSIQLPVVTETPEPPPDAEDDTLMGCDSGSVVSADPEQKVCADTVDSQPEVICGLVPGSEVRVSLDHIIDDALVVSFRLGEKIFSGVLMDLSKRFGPFGIPITVFPKREYKDKPESMQLKMEAFQPETEKADTQRTSDVLSERPVQGPSVAQPSPNPEPNPWTVKPPPLFQEGAPYPPPLFIRDTYNQSLPQPPPRKIKRPKRRLYREEPTSIMNAIKLRPRQVLCDKCKGAVVQGEKRETRRGPVSDCRSDDAKRRRNESTAPGAGKRPRNDARSEDRSRSADVPKRQASAIRVTSSAPSTLGQSQVKGTAAGSRVIKGVCAAAAASANARVQLSAKKVLQSKNVDHSKAREVLKMAKAQKRQRESVTDSSGNTKAMTRAATLQEAHQKVHFTRRLQQISGGGPGMSNPLPPRMRIKPQRYRNEENDSSSCKPPCLEKVPGGGRLALPKLAAPRCTSTRSAGQATAAAEPQGPDRELDPPLRQARPKPQPLSQPPPDHSKPQPEPEEQGQEMRGSKAGNLVVYMTLKPRQPDSSSTSMCSVDSADDLKSSNSECSSTETLEFPPPGDFRSASAPGTSSTFVSATSSAPKDSKKRSKSLKAAVFSKNVSKCVALDGRTICVGDIVWAKILGFPWWPARILAITVSRKDNGLLVRQEARVSWFGSPTTSFLAITQLAPFLENFQSRFDKKRKGLYRKAITEAAKAAKQLTPEVRALLTQFETLNQMLDPQCEEKRGVLAWVWFSACRGIAGSFAEVLLECCNTEGMLIGPLAGTLPLVESQQDGRSRPRTEIQV
ncbi:PWWP domain-containing protein 2A isoform X1 [Silurus asotus]|uniref:PWWP domain-containing protein 2A isoform X1 n=1 Tax=Silurus asotus TaxID=30991 RepID=A0AAD5AUL4_SILAS|nr:PWWP domain-containing protein 2A isoform X1 [Silurus asotus]